MSSRKDVFRDVFVTLPATAGVGLVSLSRISDWATDHGIAVQGEHLMIAGVPVQLLPAYKRLVEEAIEKARVHEYEGVPCGWSIPST